MNIDEPEDVPGEDPETTADLLSAVRRGDSEARERLFERCMPRLQQWAHRRLPTWARDIADTDDLVQVTLIRALARVDTFEARGEGAFLAYLRTILLNAVRDEIRRGGRRPRLDPLDDDLPSPVAAPLEELVGRDHLRRYDAALDTLDEAPREAVILRLEYGMSFREIAEAMGKPSEDAARMVVQRALERLAGELRAG